MLGLSALHAAGEAPGTANPALKFDFEGGKLECPPAGWSLNNQKTLKRDCVKVTDKTAFEGKQSLMVDASLSDKQAVSLSWPLTPSSLHGKKIELRGSFLLERPSGGVLLRVRQFRGGEFIGDAAAIKLDGSSARVGSWNACDASGVVAANSDYMDLFIVAGGESNCKLYLDDLELRSVSKPDPTLNALLRPTAVYTSEDEKDTLFLLKDTPVGFCFNFFGDKTKIKTAKIVVERRRT